MNKTTLTVIILLVLIITGVAIFGGNKSDEVMIEDDTMMEESHDDSMMDSSSESMSDSGSMTEMVLGTYEVYSPEKLSKADDGDVVLFFKASWCPSCRTLDGDIKKSLDDIPDDITILELDYDTETELKKKYGVTSQHTLVQVDSKGNLIQKWSGGSTLETILAKLK